MQKERGKPGRIARVMWPAALVLTTLVIWGFSLTPAEQSSQQSGFIRAFLLWLLGEGPLADFFIAHIRVRKLAHFAEYFLLGGEWAAYSRVSGRPRLWLWGLPVAVVDELLQFLSPGRAPAVTDVLLDTVGFLCGVGLVWLFVRVFCKKKK